MYRERETDAYFGDRGIVNTREEGEHAYADVQTTHMKTVRATTSTPARHLLSRPSTQDKIAAYIAAAKKMMVACRAEKTKVNPEKKPAKKISQAKKKMSKPTLTSRAIESKEACELVRAMFKYVSRQEIVNPPSLHNLNVGELLLCCVPAMIDAVKVIKAI